MADVFGNFSWFIFPKILMTLEKPSPDLSSTKVPRWVLVHLGPRKCSIPL
jgi:hypothetical protein